MVKKYKILVIDDDKNICDLLNLYLKKDGYDIIFAHDGSTGLDVFKREAPDLVILDLMLPRNQRVGSLPADQTTEQCACNHADGKGYLRR